MSRMSTPLQEQLRRANPGDLVDVVVEVSEDASTEKLPVERAARSAAIEQRFAVSTEDIDRLIRDAGGEVLAKSWLSNAIKARIPVEGIDRLLSLDRVGLIDIPRTIKRG
jgi:hypothetical protein